MCVAYIMVGQDPHEISSPLGQCQLGADAVGALGLELIGSSWWVQDRRKEPEVKYFKDLASILDAILKIRPFHWSDFGRLLIIMLLSTPETVINR